jgi:DNA-binding XRE family transcriptional regulator
LEGKSCESAISQTVNAIEKGLYRKKIVVSVFIDIASAFDRLDP